MEFKGQKSTPYIVDILHQHGVEHVIICPGSRNAPLTLAFTRHGKFNCISMIHEISAGYFALGLSKSIKKPVAIICTSGTAVLNLAPAIAEAYHQMVPLFVLTADRPDAWINQQDGQAINQKNIYSNFIARSYSLRGELYHEDDLWMTERIINEAVHAMSFQSRPVHINISFSEPLYGETYESVRGRKIEMFLAQSFNINWEVQLYDKKNILVVLGQMDFNQKVCDTVEKMAKCSDICIATENLSNVFTGSVIYNATELLGYVTEIMKPDLIVYAGGPVVSKQFKRFLATLSVPVIRIQQNDDEVDTFRSNVALIKQSPVDALGTLADYMSERNGSKEFISGWAAASEKAINKRNTYLSELKFSDLKVFEFIAKNIPSDSVIHWGNSTPVRYGQLFNDLYANNCQFYANRGTSGIDGSTSTAIGFSNGDQKTHFLITGDLSFQYDSNAFFNQHLNGRIKVITINNGGGNIFKVIEGSRDVKECTDYFETSTQHEFQHLAIHFNLNYHIATNETELNKVWSDFIQLKNNRPSVLEIKTDSTVSADIFKKFNKYIQQ